MEKPFIIKKPSYKPLLVLLNTAEELLFSYPIPLDLIEKYEKLRKKVFVKLKIKSTSLAIPSANILVSRQNLLPQSSTDTDPSQNILKLELLSLLQFSQNTTESYLQTLCLCILSTSNVHNNIAEAIDYPEKIEMGLANKIIQDTIPLLSNDDMDIDKYRQNIRNQYDALKEFKNLIIDCDTKVLNLLKIFKIQQKKGTESEIHYNEEINRLNETQYKNKILEYENKLKDLTSAKKTEKKIWVNREESLLSEIEELKASIKKMSEDYKNYELNLQENIKLKDQIISIELLLAAKTGQIAETTELIKNLEQKVLKQKNQINELECKSHIQEKDYKDIKNNLENKIFSIQTENQTLHQSLYKQEQYLNNSTEEYILELKQAHQEEIQSIQQKNDKKVQALQQKIQDLSAEKLESEDQSKKIIKSLQLDLLKFKERPPSQDNTSKDLKSLFDELSEKDLIINKLETTLEDNLNSLSYINEIISPVYYNYAHLQKDWSEQELSHQIMKKIGEDNLEIFIYAHFAVFFLEKTLRDKQWLFKKLEEVYSETKMHKTTSVGSLTSPSSLRDREFFTQIWKDIKETTEALKKFEKSRENLIIHFNKP